MTAQLLSARATLASAILLSSAFGCSPRSTDRSPPTSATPAPGRTLASPIETPRPTNIPHSQVVVAGDFNTTFEPSQPFPYSVGDSVAVNLVSPDQASRVVIFLPPDIEPGTFSIADSFANPASGIPARFGVFSPTLSRYYESTGGTIAIAEASQLLSGTFNFTATNSFAGTSVTVEGSFEGILWGL